MMMNSFSIGVFLYRVVRNLYENIQMICIIRQKYFCPLFCWPNLLSCLCPTWKTILFSSHFLHPRPENVTRSQTDQLHNTPAILNYFCSSFLIKSLELVNFVGARVSGYSGKLMQLNFSWKVTFFFSCKNWFGDLYFVNARLQHTWRKWYELYIISINLRPFA